MTSSDPWDALWDLIDDRLPGREVLRSDVAATIADAIRSAGWRPPAQIISTRDQLDGLAFSFPCVVREVPPEDELEFYPQIWEKTFQTDGWARAGRMHDEADCTPTLPVEVIAVEVSER